MLSISNITISSIITISLIISFWLQLEVPRFWPNQFGKSCTRQYRSAASPCPTPLRAASANRLSERLRLRQTASVIMSHGIIAGHSGVAGCVASERWNCSTSGCGVSIGGRRRGGVEAGRNAAGSAGGGNNLRVATTARTLLRRRLPPFAVFAVPRAEDTSAEGHACRSTCSTTAPALVQTVWHLVHTPVPFSSYCSSKCSSSRVRESACW